MKFRINKFNARMFYIVCIGILIIFPFVLHKVRVYTEQKSLQIEVPGFTLNEFYELILQNSFSSYCVLNEYCADNCTNLLTYIKNKNIDSYCKEMAELGYTKLALERLVSEWIYIYMTSNFPCKQFESSELFQKELVLNSYAYKFLSKTSPNDARIIQIFFK